MTRILPWLLLLALLSGCTTTVRVEWSTETELNTAGFNLYRGEAPDGPFPTRVNAQLIPAAADPLAGGSYSYLDHTVRPGHTYYYELQEVEQSGAINRFGPIAVRASWFVWPIAAGLALAIILAVLFWLWRRHKAATHSAPAATDVRT